MAAVRAVRVDGGMDTAPTENPGGGGRESGDGLRDAGAFRGSPSLILPLSLTQELSPSLSLPLPAAAGWEIPSGTRYERRSSRSDAARISDSRSGPAGS